MTQIKFFKIISIMSIFFDIDTIQLILDYFIFKVSPKNTSLFK